MLKQRVVTAIVLLAVLLGTLLAPSPWPLVLLLTVMAACALWEWLRMTWPGKGPVMPVAVAVVIAFALLVLGWQWLGASPAEWATDAQLHINRWLLPAVSIVWVVVVIPMVFRGQAQERSAGNGLSLFGVVAIVAVWAALAQLFLARGSWFLVSLLALIWFADIAAYFTGKALGRHKLAPRVSPGKTWEGAVGGVVAGTLWVLISSYWSGSFGALLLERWSWSLVVLIAMSLTALSIIGDLFESLLKRRAGFKDSSRLLPGHGGVYDRIDALLPIAPLALLLTGAGNS